MLTAQLSLTPAGQGQGQGWCRGLGETREEGPGWRGSLRGARAVVTGMVIGTWDWGMLWGAAERGGSCQELEEQIPVLTGRGPGKGGVREAAEEP